MSFALGMQSARNNLIWTLIQTTHDITTIIEQRIRQELSLIQKTGTGRRSSKSLRILIDS